MIGRGTALEVEAQPGSLWAFCAETQRIEAHLAGLTALPAHTLLSPSAAPDDEILLSPPPQCRSHNLFVEEASNLRIGIWDSTPYTRKSRPHKLHELMHLLEGSVTLQAADGSDLTVNTGDTVFRPAECTVCLEKAASMCARCTSSSNPVYGSTCSRWRRHSQHHH
nr:hypothetical protein GCM10020185_66140 [Pseudomonas brassicacearum subsp. brassicacearum]